MVMAVPSKLDGDGSALLPQQLCYLARRLARQSSTPEPHLPIMYALTYISETADSSTLKSSTEEPATACVPWVKMFQFCSNSEQRCAALCVHDDDWTTAAHLAWPVVQWVWLPLGTAPSDDALPNVASKELKNCP
jgi:hypothetical protein